MSKFAHKPILIPEKVKIAINPSKSELLISGPNFKISKLIPDNIIPNIYKNYLHILKKQDSKQALIDQGTFYRTILNLINGCINPFTISLKLNGLGFKVKKEVDEDGTKLLLVLGHSHSHLVEINNKTINVSINENEIILTGPDKDPLGKYAAQIRSYRKPNPYTGKGVFYSDEQIVRKAGKSKK